MSARPGYFLIMPDYYVVDCNEKFPIPRAGRKLGPLCCRLGVCRSYLMPCTVNTSRPLGYTTFISSKTFTNSIASLSQSLPILLMKSISYSRILRYPSPPKSLRPLSGFRSQFRPFTFGTPLPGTNRIYDP